MSTVLKQAKIYIRYYPTLEVRSMIHPEHYSEGEGLINVFVWEEGNYSCDCNRGLFFSRIKGEPENWEAPCSNGLYAVNIEVDGEMVYKEF